jgi:pimeloyl-ACP methyl ester carboxylesterase
MKSFEHNGFRFPVRDTGPVDGPVVVLLHGFPQDASSFDRVVPFLHARGLRTLVPLQRGYAPSARPAHRWDYRLPDLVGDVVALIDAAEQPAAHVVGHDWGGVVGWALAARHPERVSTLTAISVPHPAAFLEALVRSDQAVRSTYIALFQVPWLPEAVLRHTLYPTLIRSGLPDVDAARYCDAMAAGALTGALHWYRALPLSGTPPRSARISVPTTYIWGRRDFALGRVAAVRTEAHVAADYKFVDLDAGHWLPETRPAEVAAAILDRVLPCDRPGT